jgi:hypothetical protein
MRLELAPLGAATHQWKRSYSGSVEVHTASPQRHQRRSAAFIEPKGGRQPVDRVRIREAPHATLEVGDAACAQTGRACQLFLGQACQETMSSQLPAKL